MVSFKSSPTSLRSRRGMKKFVILYIFYLSMRLKNIVIFMCTEYANNIELLYLFDIIVIKKTNYSAYFKSKT